jgi:DNA repair protein RadC
MATANINLAVPPLDRPREKLLRLGAEGLGTNELLAVVLGTGTINQSALELANQILGAVGGLKGLARWSPEELAGLRGLKEARVARVLASLELGRRVISEPESPRPSFRVPEDAGRYLLPRFSLKPVEEFGVLVLDTRNRLKKLRVISKGSLNGSLVHPREVYREAVTLRAAGLILFHNHPSGDPTPSREDLELTRRLREAGKIMGIEILDHIILGAGRFLSFKDKGLI